MITKYATKRDINGNTYKLIIDTERLLYALENTGFFHRSDFVTIGKRERARMIETLKDAGYKEINAI